MGERDGLQCRYHLWRGYQNIDVVFGPMGHNPADRNIPVGIL
jgi:hypothetical protein